jgi:uncharacterized membrane protein
MEAFFILLGLLLLAFPIIAIVALIKSIALDDQVRLVNARLAALEGRLAAGLAGATAPEPPRPADSVVIPEPPQPIMEEPAGPAAPAPEEEAPITAGAAPPNPPAGQVAPAAPRMSFEERFGTQWTVWVGGLALALGGIFLVRYSIEQGLIGPGVRVMLGALLAVALIVAGEWTRRRERVLGMAALPTAHIPGVLTAAGTTVAYADVYAAHALYDLVGPGAAFLLLGVAALATLAAALLHGAALAGLGMVGAYATPLLVQSSSPNYWALYLYLAIVTAAAFALARFRMWRWLAITALAFSFMWTFPGSGTSDSVVLLPHVVHVVIGFALAAVLIVAGLLYGPPAEPGRVDAVSAGALAAYLVAAAALVLSSRHEPLALIAFAALAVAAVAIAWRTDAAAGALPVGAVLAGLVIARWALDLDIGHLVAPSGPVAGAVPEPPQADVGWHLALGAGFAALFGGAGFLAQGRSVRPLAPILWAASAVFTPLAILAALFYRIARFEPSIPFAMIGLALAALFAFATEKLDRRGPRPGLAAAGALFATGAVAALALALTMALEKGWLTIGLALMVPGVAWVAQQRPWPVLRALTAVVGVLVLVRIAWRQGVVGAEVGTTPIFNWLLYGYGVPAAAFWLGGYLLRRRADDASARVIDSGALVLTVLTVFLEIRHYINNGDIYREAAGLAEVGLQVCIGLAMTIGLERLRRITNSAVHDIGALVIAGLTLIAIILGLGIIENPMNTGQPVGGPFINLILLGYAIPAMLAAALALLSRGVRPPQYSAAAAVTAVALALGYLSLEVRTLFHGEVLTEGPTTDAEQYTYSAVWLVFGAALLAAGLMLRSQAVRFASAAVVILTVLKVFLIDMHDLTGIYQGLSFIGLGAVLLGIGWLYQRLLFPRRAGAAATGATS